MDKFLDLPNAELIRRAEHNIKSLRDAIKEARDWRQFKEVTHLNADLTMERDHLEMLNGRTW